MPNQSSLPLDPPAAGPASGPKKLEAPPTVTHVYGISCGMPAEAFFRLLAHGKIGLLVDTRISRFYQSARFADGDDLAYLCRHHGVEYAAEPELAPTKDLREELERTFTEVKKAQDRDPEAWSRFLEGYARLLVTERKFLRVGGPTHRLLYEQKHHAVAFLCACGQPEDCHRSVLVGLIGRFVEGVRTGQLMPTQLKDDAFGDQAYKSPRRYRVRRVPSAGLEANAPKAAMRDLAQWRQKHPPGGTP